MFPILTYRGIWHASLMAQMVKNPPAMQETRVWSLGRVNLEKGMATHSSTLAWRIPWTEEPGGLQFVGLQRVGHDWVTNTFTFTYVLQHALCRFVLFCFALSSQFESKLPEGTELVNFVTKFSPFLSVGTLYIFIEWINLRLTLLITFISFNVYFYIFYTW